MSDGTESEANAEREAKSKFSLITTRLQHCGGINIELINVRYKRIYFPKTLVLFWLYICSVARVRFFWVWILISLKRILIKEEEISIIILNSFERMPLGNQRSLFHLHQRISLHDEEWM